VELDRIAHNINHLLKPKASSVKKHTEKVNQVIFQFFIIPHLLLCGGKLQQTSPDSPLFLISFSSILSFSSIFTSLSLFNPICKHFNEINTSVYIIADEKYPIIFRFSSSISTLSISFYQNSLNASGVPMNDLYV
jgi:hypothetical protein